MFRMFFLPSLVLTFLLRNYNDFLKRDVSFHNSTIGICYSETKLLFVHSVIDLYWPIKSIKCIKSVKTLRCNMFSNNNTKDEY